MTEEGLAAAEQRHAETIGTAATLVFSDRKVPARVITRRGTRLLMDGGTVQERSITALVLCSALPEAAVVDASTGDTRGRTFTYDDLTWQITAGGVERSPKKVYWLIRATQSTR